MILSHSTSIRLLFKGLLNVAGKTKQLAKLQEQDDESFKAVMRGERTQADHERYIALLEHDKQQLQDDIAVAQKTKGSE